MIKIPVESKRSIHFRIFWLLGKVLKFSPAPLLALAATVVVTLLVNGEEISRGSFSPGAVIGILESGRQVLLLFLFFLGAVGLVYLFFGFSMSKKSDDYRAKLVKVTDKIETPAAMGQSQHGSARWMKRSRADKVFTTFVINRKKNTIIKKLIAQGLAYKADLKIFWDKEGKHLHQEAADLLAAESRRGG